METIKINLTLKSPTISKFQSDTIFGHFAWGVYYLYGEKRLKELLSNFKETPFIVFSDGFEEGKLPKPFLDPYMMPPQSMDLNKKYKKTSFIPKKWILDNINNLTDEKLFNLFKEKEFNECLKNPCNECKEIAKVIKSKETILMLKNSINREQNKTTEGLYSINETFYKDNFKISIYSKYDNTKLSLKEIKEAFEFIGKRGYGKDKSAGKGKFEVEILEEFDEKRYFQIDEKKTFYLNFSTMFKDNNLELSYGKKFTKFPKTGGNLAYNFPFKNPIMLFQAGSTFIIKNHKEYYGSAKDNLFNKNGYFHSGYSIGIYFGVGQ